MIYSEAAKASAGLFHSQARTRLSGTPPSRSSFFAEPIKSLGPHMQNIVVSETGTPAACSSSCCAVKFRMLPLATPWRVLAADSVLAKNLSVQWAAPSCRRTRSSWRQMSDSLLENDKRVMCVWLADLSRVDDAICSMGVMPVPPAKSTKCVYA